MGTTHFLSGSREATVEVLSRDAQFTVDDIDESTDDCSTATIRRVVNDLVDDGTIEVVDYQKTGGRRKRVYEVIV